MAGTQKKMVEKKKVRIRHAFYLEHEVPADWDDDLIRFHFTGSSSCASNIVDDLNKIECVCSIHEVDTIEACKPR
jgi:hypothetical protein